MKFDIFREKYGKIISRKYIALAPGRKGKVMQDIEAQALELFRRLTPEQKLEFIQLAHSQPLQSPEEPSSDMRRTVLETKA